MNKRMFDLIVSMILIFLLSPLLVLIFILVKFKFNSPVIFKQIRIGLNEKPFFLYKFRTMTEERDEDGNLLSDKYRITSFGCLLRKTSFDELPQLFNIVKSDMSFVGPRPLLTEYLDLYSDKERMRHLVKPGLTGWAQINGRNNITWKQRFEYDVWYVQNRSQYLDIKIIFITVLKIIKREGISRKGEVTIKKFNGKES